MTSWPTVSLGEICSPKQHPTLTANELLKAGFPVFGANGQIGYFDKYTHKEPTIAITCRGATCGTINVTPPRSYITGNAMALDALDKSKVEIAFLAYALKTRGLRDVISGSAQPQITRSPLLSVRVPLPPLDEQRRIAAILDQADDLRRKRREAFQKISGLGSAIFMNLFGDPRQNDLGLKTTPLRDLVENQDSIRIPVRASDREDTQGEYPYYGASGIIDYVNNYLFEGERLLVGEDGANLLARTSPIAFRATGKFWVNNHAHVLADCGPANLVFLEYHFDWIDLAPYVTGTAQPKLTRASLDRIPFLHPARESQDNFAARVAEIDKLKVQHRAHLAELDALFASLQHHAFRGEL